MCSVHFFFSEITICIQSHKFYSCNTSGPNTWTHVIKHVCPWPTHHKNQSASWAGRPLASFARRENSWPPLSTHCSYLDWHCLKDFCQMLSKSERLDRLYNPREWDNRGDGEHGVAFRSTLTDLWLSAFKTLAVPGPSFWSQKDRVRFKCCNNV